MTTEIMIKGGDKRIEVIRVSTGIAPTTNEILKKEYLAVVPKHTTESFHVWNGSSLKIREMNDTEE